MCEITGNIDVTLPLSFSNITYSIQATIDIGSSYAPAITAKTISSFTIHQVNSKRTSTILAVGY